MPRTTIAVIIGSRDSFPHVLVREGRKDTLALFREMKIVPVILGEKETRFGAVETWEHAKRCAELFQANRERIDGILVTLPNFGNERGVADAIKLSGLNVPVLVQAYPDDTKEMGPERRRDAFCGKLSVCNNLRQYGVAFSLTQLHTVHPKTKSFRADLDRFVGVCRVVKGLRNARIGAIGPRPAAFNTVRYSEKILQDAGISVCTLDLSEVIGRAQKMADSDRRVRARAAKIKTYAASSDVPEESLVKMAKLGIVISDWMQQNDLHATAIQCWRSLQQNYGVSACALMSMMSENMMPSACEVDITGALSMYALQLASAQTSALADWNNNYDDDPNKCVLFHCGNWPRAFLPDAQITTAETLGRAVGKSLTYGTMTGRAPAGPMTFARISTDDRDGVVQCYVGEGRFTDDPLETFGAKAVVEVPGLQNLMQYVCKWGFEHHVAVSASHVPDILAEAFETYLGWETYRHRG